MPGKIGLSKSKIAAFEQCPKRLWLQVHRPEMAEVDDGAQMRFAAGHAIGQIACELCPSGVMVEAEPDLRAALAETRRLIAEGHPGPIFEATFEHDGVLVRVDILERRTDGRWVMREVKSSTSAKPHHDGDLATQIWVVEENGLSLASAGIRHVNRDFVLEAVGNHIGLFADAERLADLRETIDGRAAVTAAARQTLDGPEPSVDPGSHCDTPYACEFAAHCWKAVPTGPEWPVSLLPYGAGRRHEAGGIADLLDLDEATLSERDARIVAATRSGIPFHDVEGARLTIDDWGFPRAWIDFETIAFPVPRWLGTRPYEQLPFQFSLHLEQVDGTITHHEFLSSDGEDPRGACAEALVGLVPEEATLIAYNAGFEKRVIRGLAVAVPAVADRLNAMADATVDLLPVTRSFWYHRDQRGSWSLKAVLPTIAPLDYAGLEVKDGGMAQDAYLEASDPATTPARRRAVEAALRAYCRQDTWAMVVLARRLTGEQLEEPS